MVPTPLGPLTVTGDVAGLTGCRFDAETDPTGIVPQKIVDALNGFFDGYPDSFKEITIHFKATDFQTMVWTALWGIPYGMTLSYGKLARRVASQYHARAVAAAAAANPFAIVVPCHRLIRADGTIGGYAWGTNRKEKLLAHEKRTM